MSAIEEQLKKKVLTQAQAAELLGILESRISDLKCGKMHAFTIDALTNMLSKVE